MHSLKILTFITVLISQIIITPLFANPMPARMDSLILQGKLQFYNFNITASRHTFEIIRKEFPDYPHGYFYESYLTLIAWSQDMTNDSLGDAVLIQVNRAVNVAETYKKNNSDKTEADFLLGLCYGVKGIQQTVNRNYIKTYWYGRKAKGYLEDVIKSDSTYYDAYLGLGIFHYYVDLMPGVVKFFAGILGFHGDREKGRNEVLLTSRKGRYFKEEAYFTYYVIRYFLEGDKQAPVEKFREMSQRYPGNPALKLMLAYHYRRFGDLGKTIAYCNAVPDSFLTILPQIVEMKYYNLAVAQFSRNQFYKADSLFDRLIALPTRKSLYYQAAIRYYKGLLAKLNFDEKTSTRFFKYILLNKQSKYWYAQAQMFLKYPMDSLTYKLIYIRNMLYNRQQQASLQNALKLKKEADATVNNVNPDIPYLVTDLLAENYYFSRQYRLAKELYSGIEPDLPKMEDEFRRAWIYIRYARCLRALGDYDRAEKMLNRAHKFDDDFTRIIISREKYLLKSLKQRQQKEKVKL